MISKSTISQIMDSIDIVDVVNDFAPLKKKGQNFWAPCPFHNEKTPSFSVAPNKQIYKCFGCGRAGDAVKFVRDHEGFSYVEALKYLAGKYNIVVEEEEVTPEFKEKQDKRDSLFIVLNYARDYFRDKLKNSDEGQSIGLSYFKERGFSEVVMEEYDLGYSMDDWEAFSKEAQKKEYQEEFLVETGLSYKKDNGNLIDVYRGRVMFPIHNIAGKVVGFGGRTLKSGKKEAKYINTKETDVYSKRKILYGAYQAKNPIRNEDNCFLVEGYTDVISLSQGGIKNVVASSGTSLTSDQIRLVRRYTKNITFLFDGDEAGIKASLRGLDLVLEEEMNVLIVTFPEGEDPDSYIRKVGGDEFKKYVDSTKTDFITYKSNLFLKDAANDPIKKAQAIKEVVQSIAKINDKITREVYCKQCATIFEVAEGTVISEVNKLMIKDYNDKKKQDQRKSESKFSNNAPPPPDGFDAFEGFEPMDMEEEEAPPDHQLSQNEIIQSQEKEIVRLLLNYSDHSLDEGNNLAEFILENIQDVEIYDPSCKLIIDHFQKSLQEEEMISANYFFKLEDEGIKTLVVDLLMEKYQLDKWEEKHEIVTSTESDRLDSAVVGRIMKLKWKHLQLLIMENDEKLKEADVDRQIELIQLNMALKQSEMEIAKQLNNVISR